MTTFKGMKTIAALAAVAALGAASGAHAATNVNDLIANKDALCATQAQPNAELVVALKAAKDEDAMRAILAPSIKANPANAMCIMDAVKAQAPALSKQVFQIIIALLSNDAGNDPIVKKLTEDNQDIIAMIAGDVEPAAGPADENGNTQEDPNGGGNPENPNQLNEDDATTPPASPSVP